VGCAGPRPVGPPPPAIPIQPSGLRITLVWEAPVDLDLYVTNPLGETVYYGNPAGAFAGDARCDTPRDAGRVESAGWRKPRSGRYRVGVDFPERCEGAPDMASYRLVIDRDGRREEHTGVARHLVRDPIVAEVEVP
jgi:hypothetical protein